MGRVRRLRKIYDEVTENMSIKRMREKELKRTTNKEVESHRGGELEINKGR